MGEVTPIRSGRVTLDEKISTLPIVDEVDEMLRDGLSSPDIAKYIQGTFELLTEVSPNEMRKALNKRRKALPPPPPDPQEWPAAHSPEEALDTARTPGKLSQAQYRRAVRGIDTLLETESLYLAQRDRIDRMMTSESTNGEHYEGMPKEMDVALEMLKTHAKMQEQFGPSIERMRLSLEIQSGTATGAGQRVAEAMQNPESRHKVLSFFQRLSKVAKLPVIDGEAEPVGGS